MGDMCLSHVVDLMRFRRFFSKTDFFSGLKNPKWRKDDNPSPQF
jgi:hypothetical protein